MGQSKKQVFSVPTVMLTVLMKRQPCLEGRIRETFVLVLALSPPVWPWAGDFTSSGTTLSSIK